MGVATANSILLVSFARTNLALGQSPHAGALDAGVTRLRPVMMTALMAAIGLLPAAISHGIGSESSRPLARVVIGGILCAMIFSLWVFPLIFAWSYKNIDEKFKTHFMDEELTREDPPFPLKNDYY